MSTIIGMRTLAILLPCPKCEHRNRVALSKSETLRMLREDALPTCKGCGVQLKSGWYDEKIKKPYRRANADVTLCRDERQRVCTRLLGALYGVLVC